MMLDVMARRIHEMHADGYIELFEDRGERSWRLTNKGWCTLCAAAERRAKPITPSRAQLKAELAVYNFHWIR